MKFSRGYAMHTGAYAKEEEKKERKKEERNGRKEKGSIKSTDI